MLVLLVVGCLKAEKAQSRNSFPANINDELLKIPRETPTLGPLQNSGPNLRSPSPTGGETVLLTLPGGPPGLGAHVMENIDGAIFANLNKNKVSDNLDISGYPDSRSSLLWNDPNWLDLPECQSDLEFSQQLLSMRDNEGVLCRPTNQVLNGTAAGFWFLSLSTDRTPLPRSTGSFYDELKNSLWLFESIHNHSTYIVILGENTFDMEQGKYGFITSPPGNVNRGWNHIDHERIYCAELQHWTKDTDFNKKSESLLLFKLSENATSLALEVSDNTTCGSGPWSFQDKKRIFYR